MITMIVGRCHVSDSHRDVIRYVQSRMRKGAWAKLSRADRHTLMRAIIKAHNDNRAQYVAVMGDSRLATRITLDRNNRMQLKEF